MTQDQIFALVEDERIRQDDKWGEQNHDPFTWLAILGEEVGEANKAALEARFGDEAWLEDYAQELIQVAAVAFAMIECLERRKWCWPPLNHAKQNSSE
jgi:hypothetical protein